MMHEDMHSPPLLMNFVHSSELAITNSQYFFLSVELGLHTELNLLRKPDTFQVHYDIKCSCFNLDGTNLCLEINTVIKV